MQQGRMGPEEGEGEGEWGGGGGGGAFLGGRASEHSPEMPPGLSTTVQGIALHSHTISCPLCSF